MTRTAEGGAKALGKINLVDHEIIRSWAQNQKKAIFSKVAFLFCEPNRLRCNLYVDDL